MPKSLRVVMLSLVSIIVACCSSPGLFAVDHGRTTNRILTVQGFVPQDLSGSYDGVIYFHSKANKQCLMVGPAKLEIQGQQFTLSNSLGKPLRGKITAGVITDKENLGVGGIEPENESSIEIRWHQDKGRNILKIVSAIGAKRMFRFCSANLTQAQCFGKIS